MINSFKGQEMLRSISPIYEQCKVMQSIYETIGIEFDNAERLADEVLRQLFPQTATWGLRYWEDVLNIPISESLPVHQRRARILTKMQTRWPVTKERMIHIAKNFTNDENTNIIEFFNEYVFSIIFDTRPGNNIEELNKIVSEVRPAHLEYFFVLNFRLEENKIYFVSSLTSGEEITVYPYSIRDIESKGKIYIATGNNTGLETMTVYPRKEGVI